MDPSNKKAAALSRVQSPARQSEKPTTDEADPIKQLNIQIESIAKVTSLLVESCLIHSSLQM